jgi:hypothetical protein
VEGLGQPIQVYGDIPKFLQILIEASKSISPKLLFRSVGTVQYIGNGVAQPERLPDASLEEFGQFPPMGSRAWS